MPSNETKRKALSNDNNTRWTAYFKPPPVCHNKWSVTDWINWIDSHGKWVYK